MRYLLLSIFFAVVLLSCKKDEASFLKVTDSTNATIKDGETIVVADTSLFVLNVVSFQGSKKGSTSFDLMKNGSEIISVNPILKSNSEGKSFSETFVLNLAFSDYNCQIGDKFELVVIQKVSSTTSATQTVNFKVE